MWGILNKYNLYNKKIYMIDSWGMGVLESTLLDICNTQPLTKIKLQKLIDIS